jgi:hypothetical protein
LKRLKSQVKSLAFLFVFLLKSHGAIEYNMIMKIVVLSMLLVATIVSGSKNRISLNPVVSEELSKLLDSTKELHQYLFEKKEPQVKSQLNQLTTRVQKAMTVAKVEDQKGAHLNKILTAINKELNLAQSVSGEERVRFLQNAYRQIVMLYQSYDIEKKYSVYFCKLDRSVWIQEAKSKPKNPFDPDSNCGKKVQ